MQNKKIEVNNFFVIEATKTNNKSQKYQKIQKSIMSHISATLGQKAKKQEAKKAVAAKKAADKQAKAEKKKAAKAAKAAKKKAEKLEARWKRLLKKSGKEAAAEGRRNIRKQKRRFRIDAATRSNKRKMKMKIKQHKMKRKKSATLALSELPSEQEHYVIRVNDGVNFRNSKRPYWGVKRGALNPKTGKTSEGIKTKVEGFNPGDILWFLTSKKHGGKLIAMAEYTHFCDTQDEPLVPIKTYTNSEQNWKGDEEYPIQIHYTQVYLTAKQNLHMVLQCGATIMKYRQVNKDGSPSPFARLGSECPDLKTHYKNYKFYTLPVVRHSQLPECVDNSKQCVVM